MRRRVARTQARMDASYVYEHLSKHRSKAKTERTGSNDQTGAPAAPRPSCHYQLGYDAKLHRPVQEHLGELSGLTGRAVAGPRLQPEFCEVTRPGPSTRVREVPDDADGLAASYIATKSRVPPPLPRQPQSNTPPRLVDLHHGHVDARPNLDPVGRTKLRRVQEPIHADPYIDESAKRSHVPNGSSEDPADGAVFQGERSPSFQNGRRR